MTIINRNNLSIFNQYMLDGIHEAMKAVGIPVTGIQNVQIRKLANKAIYNLQGQYVGNTLLSSLSSGIYIQNGTKYVVR